MGNNYSYVREVLRPTRAGCAKKKHRRNGEGQAEGERQKDIEANGRQAASLMAALGSTPGASLTTR